MADLRNANIADIPKIITLLQEFHSSLERESRIFPFDRYHVSGLLQGFIANPDGLVLVLDCGGGLGGVLAALRTIGLTSTQRQASEFAWWIDPAFRNPRHAFSMMREYERWAEEGGCRTAQFSCMHGLRGQAVAHLFERRGYRPAETNFFKVLG